MNRFTATLILMAVLAAQSTWASDTEFSFQGRLEQHGAPATGNFDFQFRLLDSDTGGEPVGDLVAHDSVSVHGGLFNVLLDFGLDAFDGSERWVETRVRVAGGGAFDTLSPRQRVTASPFALYAKTIPLAGSGSAQTAARSDHNHLGQTWGGSATHGLRVSNLSASGVSAITGTLIGGTGAEAAALSGELAATAGRAVAGRALGNSGTTIGVYGESQSPIGYAGYFEGARSYFQNRVGIGSLQPRQQLSIGANLDLYSGNANNPTRPSIRGTGASNLMLSAFGSGGTWLNFDGGTGGIRFYDGSGSEMGRFASNGRLGVGRTIPQDALHVNGDIRTEGSVVYTYPQGAFATRTRHFVRQWSRPISNGINYIFFSDDNIRLAIFGEPDALGIGQRLFIRLSPRTSDAATSWQYTYGTGSGGSVNTPTIGTWYTISNNFENNPRGGGVYQINSWRNRGVTYRVSVHNPFLLEVSLVVEAFYSDDPWQSDS